MGARLLVAALAVLAALFFTGGGGAARAEAGAQLSFSETRDPSGGLALRYEFNDRSRRAWTLGFGLPAAELQGAATGLGRYEQAVLVGRVSRAVADAVQRYQGAASADVHGARGGYELTVRYRGPRPMAEVMAEIRQAARQAADGYFAESYLKVIHANDVIPDYSRLAARFVPTLRPAAEALAAQLPSAPPRDRLALALAFLQSIPYDTVAASRPGNGYVVPTALLAQNKGDCDTKSVAMASLLATLLPGVASAVVLIPGHALLGVALPVEPGERGLRFEGRDYLLVEPVGPALLPAGHVSERTRAALAQPTTVTVLPVSLR